MKTLKKILPAILLLVAFGLYNSKVIATDPPSDKDITYAVDDELLFNATTPSYMIDVKTDQGVVTLSGSVSNILAKDRAVEIAKTVKGVRAVVDEIQVNTPYRSNADLEKDVKDALLRDPATDSYKINVSADDGMVTLTGTVDSWQEKQLSEFVAKGVIGVKGIANDIKISYKTERPDSEIQKDIEEEFKNDVRIDGALINVSVKDGNVTLSGIVGSAAEKSLASSNAWTSGVYSVDASRLEVEDWARDKDLRSDKYVTKTDQEIQNAVTDAFVYDPRVFSFNPDVYVKDGVVTLSGIVDNLKAKRAAEQDAKNVVGVFWVKNYLKVRPAVIPKDSDLEAEIENAFRKDPLIERWDVNVVANNGVVYLNGTVDSYFEKAQAEDIASKTNGVIAVENNLKVFDDNEYYFNNYYGWNTYFPPYMVNVAQTYKSDREIKDDIESQLWWSPYVNENEVKVTVVDGKATLEGTVDTEREKRYAEINALEGGATSVENDLVVRYAPLL